MLFSILSISAFAQKRETVQIMNEYKIALCKATMVKLVNDAKPYYKKGQTKEEFCKLAGNNYSELEPSYQKLADEIFVNLTANNPNELIYNNSDSKALLTIISGKRDGGSPKGKSLKGFWEKVGKTLERIGETINYLVCVWTEGKGC